MTSKKPRTVKFRRKREQKTDYLKRLKTLASKKPRLLVRFTNQKIIAQLIEFSPLGDKIIAAIDSSALKKLGWNYSCKNFPAAYLCGALIGKTALKKNCQEAILDTGFKVSLPKSRVYAFLQGALDSGLKIPHGEGIFPDEKQISGKQIVDYALQLKSKNEKEYQQKFGQYLKNNAKPEQITDTFIKVKQKIIS